LHCARSAPVNPAHWLEEDVPPAELLSLALPGLELLLVEGLALEGLLLDELSLGDELPMLPLLAPVLLSLLLLPGPDMLPLLLP